MSSIQHSYRCVLADGTVEIFRSYSDAVDWGEAAEIEYNIIRKSQV